LTKAFRGEFKVDVGEHINSNVKKQNKKQLQFLLELIITTNKTFGLITNVYTYKIDTYSIILANL
jgi:hypothetical protein